MRRAPSKHAAPLVVLRRPIFGLCNAAWAAATRRRLRAKSTRGHLRPSTWAAKSLEGREMHVELGREVAQRLPLRAPQHQRPAFLRAFLRHGFPLDMTG